MLKEFQAALGGMKQPLALYQRAAMLLVAFACLYLVLWLLHALYFGRHYAILGLALVLGLIVGGYAARLIRIAVLSPQRNGIGS